jgi:hypothetical protein
MDAVWFRRLLVLGGLLLVGVAMLAAVVFTRGWAEVRNDLAAGRPWRASSTYAVGGCKSPQQACSESADYFFHTEEEDKPWVEIDLGATVSISSVRIDNRKDCCLERAAPLLVEVSTNQKRFREVLRKDDTFKSWKGEFEPVRARYVRISATRRTALHLARVRVLP